MMVEILQLYWIFSGNLSPCLLFPHTHTDLPQIPPPVEGKPLWLVYGSGCGTGAVEITGINRVNRDICKPAGQGSDLPLAPVRDDAVGLSLRNPIEISLRLRMADQINCGHSSSPQVLQHLRVSYLNLLYAL